MSLARDLKERILKECGIEALEAKVATLTTRLEATEARIARAEARLESVLARLGNPLVAPPVNAAVEKRISALEASLGVYEAEGELR